jgi:competence protein ComEC
MGSLDGDASRVMWSSLVWGKIDEAWVGGRQVPRIFFELGMIHVLVLSGSQVGSYHKLQNLLTGAVLKWGGLSRGSIVARVGAALSWASLGAYVAATGASAPLVRAFLVLAVGESEIFSGHLSKIAVSFLLHCLLFPSHVGSLSFVLSWSAFLVLLILAEAGVHRLVGLCLLCFISQLLVTFVKGGGVSGGGWKGIFANVLFVPIFESVVFPLGSVIACLVVFVSSGGGVFEGEGIERRIFDCLLQLHEILAQVFLGALKAIRYI